MAKQLPAGMRNNNPGNIKFVGQRDAVGPSVNTDQGDPQAVYATPQAGMRAMYNLLSKKYAGGKVTPRMMIAGKGGWTPGNEQAAANVARNMGIGVDDDIRLTDPASATRFMRSLMLQEHGNASSAYSDDMITGAITGKGGGTTDIYGGNGPVNPNAPVPGTPSPANDPRIARDKPGVLSDEGRIGMSSPIPQKPQQGPVLTPTPYAPMQGPPMNTVDQGGGGAANPYADFLTAQAQRDKHNKRRDALADAVSGLGKMGGSQMARPQYINPKAARIDEAAVPTVAGGDGQGDMQRQQLAMTMARLNSGKLWV